MPILYVKTGCPYSPKVLKAAEELGLTLDIRNVAEPGVSEELIAHGGKKQMPYLIDAERNVAMYESDDIVAYLHATFTPKQ
ncbi:glutathione S-transferase N-terminal domain-containing protein [Patescibacteria group bacterium]|nr:glutathione S-transferase N-terminal domain-containing protein [Patescibacteria group bacterium]MBU2158927.1 glutathione S-transferase N-terminal domain-containing protein [Patescibacteria group bacterium]MBU2220738.1 glutathione S-transferase N-terminal domain-containing protein [Patescibacteria group bacterium]